MASSELVYSLPRLPYARLRFTLTAQESARLPAFLGSTLRGAWGHALRAIACTMGPTEPCATCQRRQGCLYPQLFEARLEGEPPPFLRRVTTPPRPYVFEPTCGADSRQPELRFQPGAELGFDLLLLGTARPLAPFAVLAVDRMAEHGLGVRRGRFRLARVSAEAATGTFEQLPLGAPAPLAGRIGEGRGEVPSRLRLHFLTPARLLDSGERVEKVELRQLIFRMLRRHLELAHFFGEPKQINWHFQPLLSACERVGMTIENLTWVDWERYSNRQRTKMTLGGLVGSLLLEGDLAPLWPLLQAATIVHVGKGATFGLGWVELTPL